MTCDICGGRKTIRLPIMNKALTYAGDAEIISTSESYRDYPCPECADETDLAHVHFVRAEMDMPYTGQEMPAGYHRHIRETVAHALIDRIFRDDFVKFEESEVDTNRMSYRVRATMGVVSKSVLEEMDKRIKANQMAVAEKVVDLILDEIALFGSHYGSQGVPKGFARQACREALEKAAANGRRSS